MEECSKCRGSGWVVDSSDGAEFVRPCPSCRSRDQRSRRLEQARIPPRYADRGFDAYSIHHPSQERAVKRAIEYVETFPHVGRGLLFAGPCGVGKTHLAIAVVRTLIEEKGVDARFVDEAELLRRLQYSYGPNSPRTEEEVLLPLMECDLLVWDDLGTGRPTDWVRETIRMVINFRYTNAAHTIMTTNWPLKPSHQTGSEAVVGTLEERIGSRLFSRVMEMCEVVEVQGPDARTEIHKASLDFAGRELEKAGDRSPEELIECPGCHFDSPRVQDRSRPRSSRQGKYVELSCYCPKCSRHFVTRFFLDSSTVDYPTSG